MASTISVTFTDDFNKVTAEGCHVKITASDGAVLSEHYVSFSSFLEALNKTHSSHGTGIETPILPNNCLKHIWYSQHEQATIQAVFVEVPKQNWDIKFFGEIIEKVGFPRMIVGYKLIDLRVSMMFIRAVKENDRIEEKTTLYYFPFSHVYKGGAVCTSDLPQLTALSQCGSIHNVFMQSEFGLDLFNHNNNTHNKGLRELFETLREKPFPDEWLVPANQSFGEWVKTI